MPDGCHMAPLSDSVAWTKRLPLSYTIFFHMGGADFWFGSTPYSSMYCLTAPSAASSRSSDAPLSSKSSPANTFAGFLIVGTWVHPIGLEPLSWTALHFGRTC